MNKAIREFIGWVKAHPFKACFFSTMTGILATWDGTRPSVGWTDLIAWEILLFVFALTFVWDGRKVARAMTVALTIGALLAADSSPAQSISQPPKARPASGAGVIVGIVVVVVGGVIIFRVIRFCQHAFPRTPGPNTNPPPAVVNGAVPYAAATSCSAIGNCYTASPSFALAAPEPITVFELAGTMVEKDSGGLAFRMDGAQRLDSQSDSVDLFEFEQEIQAWGVHFGGSGEVFYGRDGQPSTADQVPIAFTINGANSSVDASLGNGAKETVVFERSADLIHWEPILTLTVSAGQGVKFSDASSEAQMFYRSRPAGD